MKLFSLPILRPAGLAFIAIAFASSGAVVGKPRASVTVSPNHITEGEDAFFKISLSHPNPTKSITVHYAIVGSAIYGSDFFLSQPVGKVVFAPGQTCKEVILRAMVDDFDPNEAVTLVLLKTKQHGLESPDEAKVFIANGPP